MRPWYPALAGVWIGLGTVPLVVRQVDTPAPVTVFARLALGAAALALLLAVRGRVRRAAAQEDDGRGGWRSAWPAAPLLAVLCGAVLAVHWVALFAAYRVAPTGTVILVVYLAPIGVALLAPRVLGEEVGRRSATAVALAALGFAVLVGPSASGAAASGIVLAAVAMVTFVVIVLASKRLSELVGGPAAGAAELAVAAVLLAPVALSTSAPTLAADLPWLVLLGLGHTALAHGIHLAALARVPATHASTLGYLEPVAAVAIGWAVLGEAAGPSTVVGAALVLGAGLLVVAGGARDDPRALLAPAHPNGADPEASRVPR